MTINKVGGPILGCAVLTVFAILALSGGVAGAAPPCTAYLTTAEANSSVVVPTGELLCINDKLVKGSVSVDAGGGLKINGSTIQGGVDADAATLVRICSDGPGPYTPSLTIGGAVTIRDSIGEVLIGAVNPSACSPYVIKGSVDITGNSGPTTVFGNVITGGMAATDNALSLIIGANEISNSLDCTGNVPAPTDHASPNTVGGVKLHQCSGL